MTEPTDAELNAIWQAACGDCRYYIATVARALYNAGARAEGEKYRALGQAVWDAAIIMGMDNDGAMEPWSMTYPTLPDFIVREAKDWRKEMDGAYDLLHQTEDAKGALRGEVKRLRAALSSLLSIDEDYVPKVAASEPKGEPVAAEQCRSCGDDAIHRLVMDNIPDAEGTPLCGRCSQNHEAMAQDTNEHEMRNFDGAYGLVAFHYEPLASPPAPTVDSDEGYREIITEARELAERHKDYDLAARLQCIEETFEGCPPAPTVEPTSDGALHDSRNPNHEPTWKSPTVEPTVEPVAQALATLNFYLTGMHPRPEREIEAVRLLEDVHKVGPKYAAASPPAPTVEPVALEYLSVDEWAEEYEMIGEDESGRDACYTPNERERILIIDAIHGYVSDADLAPRKASPPAPTVEHSDDVAVDALVAAMKVKLKHAREVKGRGGWEDCSHRELTAMLIDHVAKGDPVDVANFCAFLHAKGWSTTNPAFFVEERVAEMKRIFGSPPAPQGWVSFEDQLPERKANFYIVAWASGNVGSAFIDSDDVWCAWVSGKGAKPYMNQPTHWMPLPESPIAGASDE